MNHPTVGILKSLKVFACQVSTISERAVLSHSQPKFASHSSSFRRWPSLSTNCYLSADVKNMRSTVNLKREAGPVRLASDTLLHINEPFFPSADTIRPVVEPRDPDVSTPEVGELQSDISDSDNNEPDMKNLDVNLKEEVGLGGKARVVRLKSSKRLSRHLSRNGESVPFLANRGRRKSFYVDNDFINPARQHSFRDDVGHAAAETFLLTRLTFSLLRYLGIGYRWVIKFMALGLYAIFLMPGFVQVGYKYFFYKNVHRSIVYGDQPRNRLDLYVPENANGPYPVVIFVTGGAWIIGYKAWGALLGLQLSDRGIMVCCTDYRNFPQGNISDMVQDITTGIGFIVNNVDEFGGDPERIYIAGQSAGCHLATCAMVEQARIEIGQTEGELAWKVSQFKGYLGISGGYNLCGLVDHFHNRGLYRRIFLSVMEGEEKLRLYSPELAVRSEAFAPAVPLLPPMHLFHGTADKSIPHEASSNFGKALNDVGATAFVKLYPDKTHTDVFLQDPMRGGQDSLFEDFVAVIHADDAEARAEDAKKPRRRRLVPEFLLRWARAVSPF